MDVIRQAASNILNTFRMNMTSYFGIRRKPFRSNFPQVCAGFILRRQVPFPVDASAGILFDHVDEGDPRVKRVVKSPGVGQDDFRQVGSIKRDQKVGIHFLS
jgi:hypothetical protein